MSLVEKMYPRALEFIDEHGFLLVFPKKNCTEPNSLWNCFYPDEPMRWDWDAGADGRVMNLWYLREKLAREREVVYGKYYQGRATVFSHKIFTSLLTVNAVTSQRSVLTSTGRELLEALEMDSPLSTKQLKDVCGLRGKMLESAFHKATKELWAKLLIVGMGEVDDGAFPSLAHGATRVVFENLWLEAQNLDPLDAFLNLQLLREYSLLEKSLVKEPLIEDEEQC